MSLTQQKRLYQAEICLWSHGREFSSIREVTDYLNDIMSMEWFIQRFGFLPSIEVRAMNAGRWAGCASRKSYAIYLKNRTEHVVLHELCHLLNSTDEHDHEFVENLTFLVRNAMGFHAWAEFSYELEKVEYYNG